MLEAKLLRAIEEQILSPENVGALVKKTELIVAQKTRETRSGRHEAVAQLHKAEQELEHIKTAIRQGIITATTRQMLEETEANVKRLRTVVMSEPKGLPSTRAIEEKVGQMVQDLHASLTGFRCGEMEQARLLLSRLLGEVLLRPEGNGLTAEVRGNLGACFSNGAGSPFLVPSFVNSSFPMGHPEA